MADLKIPFNTCELEKYTNKVLSLPQKYYECGNFELLWYSVCILKIPYKAKFSENELIKLNDIGNTWKKYGPKKDFSFSNFYELVKKLDKGIFDMKYINIIHQRFDHKKDVLEKYFGKYRGIAEHRNVFEMKKDFPKKLDIVCFSDTHGEHREINLPISNILIFCGDCCDSGNVDQTIDFIIWFANLPHKHKIFVPGNHDHLIEQMSKDEGILEKYPHIKESIKNIIFLINRTVEIGGHKIFGYPFIPYRKKYNNNAFSIPRNEMNKIKIPDDTDVLVTHFPPHGVGDGNTLITSDETGNGGITNLRCHVENSNIKYHLYGHVHNGRGIYYIEGKDTKYVNCAKQFFAL